LQGYPGMLLKLLLYYYVIIAAVSLQHTDGRSITAASETSRQPISNFTRLLQLKPKVHVDCSVLDVVKTFLDEIIILQRSFIMHCFTLF
jgi:hypothetical protein